MRRSTTKIIGVILKDYVETKKDRLMSFVENQNEEAFDKQLKILALEYRAARDALDDFEDWESVQQEE